jgi:hypothetical protein
MTNDELKALCESNARSIAATNEGISELRNTVSAFVRRLDETGLQVTLIRDLTDDQAGELTDVRERTEDDELRIDALRADAIADRLSFRDAITASTAQADADRAESARKFDAQLNEIRAQGQQIRALLSALATTNGRVDTLEQAS